MYYIVVCSVYGDIGRLVYYNNRVWSKMSSSIEKKSFVVR